MALTYPIPQITAGEYVDVPDWNALVDSINFHSNPPACRVFSTATTSLPNNATTVVTFDSERYDTDGMHSTSVNTSRITVNTAGVYIVTAHVTFSSDTDYTRLLVDILLNGATVVARHSLENPGADSNQRGFSVATVWKASATNYFEVRCLQVNTGAGTETIDVVGAISPEFSATWIGLG